MPRVSNLFVLFFFISMVGCTTVKSMETPDVKGGEVKVYDVSKKDAFDLALYACQSLNLKVKSKDFEKNFVIASNGMSVLSDGERIGIYFSEVSDKQTEIRIVDKAANKLDSLWAKKWSAEIYDRIETRLSQLKQAKIIN